MVTVPPPEMALSQAETAAINSTSEPAHVAVVVTLVAVTEPAIMGLPALSGPANTGAWGVQPVVGMPAGNVAVPAMTPTPAPARAGAADAGGAPGAMNDADTTARKAPKRAARPM